MNAHTPTPLRIADQGVTTRKDGSKWKVWDIIGVSRKGHNMAVCCVMVDPAYSEEEPEQKANAEFIVRACNAHEELIAALERARDNLLLWTDTNHGAIQQIDAAMAKARFGQ